MTQTQSPRSMWWTHPPLILALALLVGGGLRLARSQFESLNFDEMWQLKVASGHLPSPKITPPDVVVPAAPDETSLRGGGPWTRMWTQSSEITHPPLSFLFLRFWRQVFGETDLAVRSFSIFCSLTTIVLIYIAGRMTIGTAPALWAAILFAVAPVQVYEAQQVRGYALAQMLAVASALCMIRLEQKRSMIAAVGLGICSLLLIMTHYFGAGVALGLGIYALLRLRGRALWMALSAFAAAGIAFAIIWLPYAITQRGAAIGAGFLTEESKYATASAIARAASSVWRQVISDGVIALRRNSRMPWPYLPAVLFVIPLWPLRRRPQLLMWYLWLVCSIGFLLVLDLLRGTAHLRFTRYITIAGPGTFLLFTGLLMIAPRWLACAFPAAVMAASLIMSRSTYFKEEGDWDRIGQILDAHSAAGEAVVVNHGSQPPRYIYGYLFAAGHYSHTFPRPVLNLSAPATSDLIRQLPGRTAWLITSPASPHSEDLLPGPRPEELLPGSTVLEEYDVGELATCWRVQLPVTN